MLIVLAATAKFKRQGRQVGIEFGERIRGVVQLKESPAGAGVISLPGGIAMLICRWRCAGVRAIITYTWVVGGVENEFTLWAANLRKLPDLQTAA
jgi:hypothetical protein